MEKIKFFFAPQVLELAGNASKDLKVKREPKKVNEEPNIELIGKMKVKDEPVSDATSGGQRAMSGLTGLAVLACGLDEVTREVSEMEETLKIKLFVNLAAKSGIAIKVLVNFSKSPQQNLLVSFDFGCGNPNEKVG